MNQEILYNKNYKEVERWFNYFVLKLPLNDKSIYYSVEFFLIMLFIVTQSKKQFGKKPFKNIANSL